MITAVGARARSPLVYQHIASQEEYWRQSKPELMRSVLETLQEGLADENVRASLEGETDAQRQQYRRDVIRVFNMLAAEATHRAIVSKTVSPVTSQPLIPPASPCKISQTKHTFTRTRGLASPLDPVCVADAQDSEVNSALADTSKQFLEQADRIQRYAEPTLLNQGWNVLNMERDGWKIADYYFSNAAKARRHTHAH
jgi:hypothetical protein